MENKHWLEKQLKLSSEEVATWSDLEKETMTYENLNEFDYVRNDPQG